MTNGKVNRSRLISKEHEVKDSMRTFLPWGDGLTGNARLIRRFYLGGVRGGRNGQLRVSKDIFNL